MKERRKHSRTVGLVNVKYKMPTLQIEGQSLAKNISGGGIRILIRGKLGGVESLELGAMAELEINLQDDSKPIFATAEVRWSLGVLEMGKKYFDAGLKFNTIEDGDRNRIIDYITVQLQSSK